MPVVILDEDFARFSLDPREYGGCAAAVVILDEDFARFSVRSMMSRRERIRCNPR